MSTTARTTKEDRSIEPAANTWKNEDGEFELVLGNKQLLSVFFVVVILLAVFFMMGYMVGRSNGGDFAVKRNPAEPTAPRNDTTSAMPKAETPVQQAETPKPIEVSGVNKDDKADTGAASVPVNPAPAAAAETKAEAAKPLEVTAVTTSITQPAAGSTYVQVRATAKPEAELIAEILTKKGMKAIIAPGPDERRVRVLVGPMKDAADTGKAIADLEKMGFPGAFPKHY